MAIDKEIQQTLDNFKELDQLLFNGGEIPTYEELFAKVESGESLTLREAYTMRLHTEGVRIIGSVENNVQTKDRAKVFIDTFGKAKGQPPTMGGLRDQINGVLKKGASLDTPYEAVIEEARTTKKFEGVAKDLKALQAKVESFKLGNLAPKVGSAPKKFKRVPTQATIKAIVDGISRIPDAELRDAVFVSVFGMRGAQLADIATDYDTATGTENTRPYFDPETGVLESPDPEYSTRKPLPPSKTMGPIATEILQRRHAEALSAGETRLFPNVTSAKISGALKQYVFNDKYFPKKELDHLGKTPTGITDLRKIFVSYTVKELGEAKLADQLLGHPDSGSAGVVDEAISKVGARFYLTTETTQPEVYGNLLTRLEQDIAKASGHTSFTQLATGMRIEVPQDISVEFVDFDKASDDALLRGETQVRPEIVERSQEEIEQARQTRLARDAKAEEIARKEAEEAGLAREKTRAERLRAKAEADELADSQPTKKERQAAKVAEKFKSMSSDFGEALGGFFDDIDMGDFKGTGFFGTAITAGAAALGYSEASEAFEQEGMDKGTASVLGAAQTAYETLETPHMIVGRAALNVGDVGGPESVLGTTEEQRAYAEQMGGIETEFSRAQAVKELDRRDAVIAEQQGRIAEYDAKMASQQGPDTDRQMNQLLRNISGE